MAGDWIKFRKKLLRDGRVLILSRSCRADRATVLGALVILWALADEYAEADGYLPGYTTDDIDCEVGITGFCAAMPPDWMEVRNGSVYLPEYQEHNGDTAKRRAQNTVRQQARRTVTNLSRCRRDKSATREEKRREEKIEEKNPPNPPTESAPEVRLKVRQRTARDDLFDAVAEITRTDPKASGSHLGKVVSALLRAEPPYTPEEVRRLPAVLALLNWNTPVTPATVEKYIGWVRNPPPTANGRSGHGQPGGSVGPTSRVRAQPGKYDGVGITIHSTAGTAGQPAPRPPAPPAPDGGGAGPPDPGDLPFPRVG